MPGNAFYDEGIGWAAPGNHLQAFFRPLPPGLPACARGQGGASSCCKPRCYRGDSRCTALCRRQGRDDRYYQEHAAASAENLLAFELPGSPRRMVILIRQPRRENLLPDLPARPSATPPGRRTIRGWQWAALSDGGRGDRRQRRSMFSSLMAGAMSPSILLSLSGKKPPRSNGASASEQSGP